MKLHIAIWIFLIVPCDIARTKIGLVYAPIPPTLEIEVFGDCINFIDLQNIYLEVNCKILNPNGDETEYDTADNANTDSPCFGKNTLDFLFSECGVTAISMEISSANDHYAQKLFIETEYLKRNGAKEARLQ